MLQSFNLLYSMVRAKKVIEKTSILQTFPHIKNLQTVLGMQFHFMPLASTILMHDVRHHTDNIT